VRHRVPQGQKAVCFDIGWMESIGIVDETERYRQTLKTTGDFAAIQQEERLALLDIYCNPSLPLQEPLGCQLLVGTDTADEDILRGQKPKPQVERPLFSAYATPVAGTGKHNSGPEKEDAAVLFQREPTMQGRAEIATRALIEKLARLL
jgi:hypothetical protein